VTGLSDYDSGGTLPVGPMPAEGALEAVKFGPVVSVAGEALPAADRVADYLRRVYGGQPDTPEQVAEREKREAEWAAYRDDVLRDHERLLAEVTGLTKELLRLHGPEFGEERHVAVRTPECGGCDWDGMDGEPPAWPCRTYRLIGEHHGREFTGHLSTIRMTTRTD
jgi:hypothetical protein